MESTNNQTPARSSEEQLKAKYGGKLYRVCLLYTSPSPRDRG